MKKKGLEWKTPYPFPLPPLKKITFFWAVPLRKKKLFLNLFFSEVPLAIKIDWGGGLRH